MRQPARVTGDASGKFYHVWPSIEFDGPSAAAPDSIALYTVATAAVDAIAEIAQRDLLVRLGSEADRLPTHHAEFIKSWLKHMAVTIRPHS